MIVVSIANDIGQRFRRRPVGSVPQPFTRLANLLSRPAKLIRQGLDQLRFELPRRDELDSARFNLLQRECRFPAEDQGGDVDVGIDDNADHFAAGRSWARRLRTSRTVETTSASVNPRSSALGRPYAFMLSHHWVRSYCRSASRTSSLIVRCSFRAISSARVSISGGRVIESVFDVRIASLYRNA